jgi:hypothetical protein
MLGSVTLKRSRGRAPRGGKSVREGTGLGARRSVVVAAAVLFEVAGLWLRARTLGGNVVVRCRKGHLFTTIWIPGVSVKSLRLGWWRFQRCPVGSHWSWVTPVNETDLTDQQKRTAAEHKDVRIP